MIYTVIVTYNGMRNNWIEKCLNSLINSSKKTKIIVVDNASKDNSVVFIKNKYPQVHLIESEKNLGFGAANNVGISYALQNGGDSVFLLNQDAWIEPNTLKVLKEISEKNPNYGIISPLQLDGTGDRLEWGFSNSIGYDFNKDFFSDFVLNKPKKDIYETNVSYAASWFVTKECLRIVGGFNPSFFHYGEDDNYTRRVLFKNLKIGVTPLAKIFHDTYHEKPVFNKSNEYIVESRKLIHLFSDPNEIIAKNKVYKKFIFTQLKSLLTLDFERFNVYRALLTNDYKKIDFYVSNRIKSISDEKFIFLDV